MSQKAKSKSTNGNVKDVSNADEVQIKSKPATTTTTTTHNNSTTTSANNNAKNVENTINTNETLKNPAPKKITRPTKNDTQLSKTDVTHENDKNVPNKSNSTSLKVNSNENTDNTDTSKVLEKKTKAEPKRKTKTLKDEAVKDEAVKDEAPVNVNETDQTQKKRKRATGDEVKTQDAAPVKKKAKSEHKKIAGALRAKKMKEEGLGIFAPKQLSPELAAILGQDVLPRTQVVADLWSYIKKNNLITGRIITTNPELEKVLKKKTLDMFEMSGLISAHIK